MTKLLLIITTVPNQLMAEKLAKLLIKKKVAACVSMKEIKSIYKWQENIEEDKEFEITIKSLPENSKEITHIVKENITYEVPQLIYKIFDADISYFNWVKESIK